MLKIDKVSKAFGGIAALSHVSVTVEEGTITGIIGPNGAGKTTLFNIVTGLYPPDEGEVYLQAQRVTFLPPEKLVRLGLVRTFQNLELFGRMTILENVMVGLYTKSSAGLMACALRLPKQRREEERVRREALKWIDFCGLAEVAEKEAASLPLGQGRLLEIARALATNPKIILMDEPAAGLNTRETAALAELMRKIREMGVTVVLVEHDMELVMEVCDRISVLNLGQKLAEGTPREIQDNPAVINAYLGED
ncbi:MAG TPA: ABC transporter ATP-binding protein [Syntrophales bacterium]|nr:ABC transporter ATP-binding protein [Syntrophales bacterium]HOL58365.1 ABC transporter ATP-binding protein [Syntrophales bacterium]HPO34534.1 ABC transporter ATP-binding protein [Syntrophales bacterium]